MDEKVVARFWPKVNKDGPVPPHMPHLGKCWVWTAAVFKGTGYGMLGVAGKSKLAHRLSWEIFNGPIVGGLFVLHACDNPPCVNPAHLRLGTQRDNRLDCKAKGRTASGLRHGRGTMKLNDEGVRAILSSTAPGTVLAIRHGVSQQTVCDIRKGRRRLFS